MPEPRILRIYLDPVSLRMAREGSFGFVKRVRAAFGARGFEVSFTEDTDAERLLSEARPGYSLFLMKDPFHPRALSMRRAYYYPFWRIEASAKRWEFRVAQKHFNPDETDTDIATEWFNRWRRFLFRKKPLNAERSGLIYVPLQGRLLDHRSFQSMSPVEMIGEVQARAGGRRILLGLHPGESHAPDEIAAVERIAADDPRVTLQKGGMEEALRICDLVVTQNSTAALSGFFFRKPAMLFGETDFHHQMPRVSALGVDEAWRMAEEITPAYARYLYWFIQLNAIKADTEMAESQIVETCRSHGWEV
ncbi:hypothetical protein [Sinisalibacter aestuarii]|uniref:Capsule polysaccharide biosynthesis protein n=1 Tax=Sinisalibacter aestuarii TaxID=2949426 RepID=A0ABQ5LN51_9RHOB|nr:hypothetical protein [Sinisalibacter aestuarii]GKY86434.1 hypothetical protein STA1M1_03030 [Sinisalibacter aestuarii]